MKSRYAPRRQSFVKIFTVFILVIILAMGAGYVAAKHVIMPYLFEGKDFDEDTPLNVPDPAIVSGEQDTVLEDLSDSEAVPKQVNEGDPVILYGIQYGSFNEKKRAESALGELDSNKVEACIMTKNGSYKVISSPYIDEQKARKALTEMKEIVGEDIFLVPMEVCIK